jgi:ActR/RegA family two-component response regulator
MPENDNPCLLIVDNNRDQLKRWRAAAEQAGGYSILTATNYEDAVDTLHNNLIDVLVADLFLTDEAEMRERFQEAQGLNLIQSCRDRYPRSVIIAITGFGGLGTSIGTAAYSAGATDFISRAWKYIDIDVLLTQKLQIFHKLVQLPQEKLTLAMK